MSIISCSSTSRRKIELTFVFVVILSNPGGSLEYEILLANEGPTLAKKLLKAFAISLLSPIFSSSSTKKFGRLCAVLPLLIKPFNIFQVP